MLCRIACFALALAFAAPAVAQVPGRLIASTPLAGAPDGARAYRIRYHSLATDDRPIVVSGMVIVPPGRAPAAGRDVVGWAHGSYGVAEKCAPLKGDLQFSTIPGLDTMLARGWIVAATDYQGLGNPGPHPYLAGEPSARAVIDAVRAAGQLPRARPSGRFAAWGESQGGHAALWTGKIAARYAPELKLAGVAAAAPPTDLKANLTGGTNPAVRALLTAFTAHSWSRVHSAPISAFAPPRTERLIDRLAVNNCISLDGFRFSTKLGLGALTAQLRNADIAKPEPWRALIARHSVTPAGLTMPVLIAQGSADPIVAPSVTEAFITRLCRRGGTVGFIGIDGGEHIDIGQRSAAATVAWLGDRFAGRRASNDCRKL